MNLIDFVDRFLRSKKIEGCTAKTLQAYRYELDRFLNFAEKELNRPAQLNDFDRDLVEDWLTNREIETPTRSRTLASLKSFSRFLLDRDHIKANPLDALKTPRARPKVVSYLSENEFQKLLNQAKGKSGPREIPGRDYAILALFIGSGIRISELAGLTCNDVDTKAKQIKVTRKGGKGQIVPYGEAVQQALIQWIEHRQSLRLPQKVSAFFISNRKRPMSIQTIRNVVKKYMKQAGLWGKKMSPHTLRHSYATAQIASGTPVQVVQDLMGHNQLNTTSKYLHLVDKDRKKAAEKIQF